MKRLLLTSDDFGMCRAVNRGIEMAMTEGIIRSSNLMAPCAWLHDAVRIVRKHGLAVGVHLTATCEWEHYRYRPLTAGRSLQTLGGAFPKSHEELSRQVDYAELASEYRAQLDLVIQLGVAPTHLDTHMIGAYDESAHGLRIQEIVKRLAREYGLPYTYERATPESPALRYFVAEHVMSPSSPEETLACLESWTKPGDYHLIAHAAVDSPELDGLTDEAGTAWAKTYRLKDLTLLTCQRFASRIGELGFSPLAVGDLVVRG